MTWDSAFKIITAGLGAVGGASVIIWGLATWFGKIWANKILERDKSKYAAELEKIKQSYSKELENYKSQLEITKVSLSRYSEKQFHIFNEIWQSLYDLKIIGNQMLNKRNEQKFKEFAEQLIKTRQNIDRNQLFLEERHYQDLKSLLKNLLDYNRKELEVRIHEEYDSKSLDYLLTSLESDKFKKEYDALIESVRNSFRAKMQGQNSRSTH